MEIRLKRFLISKIQCIKITRAQSAGAVKYTECISLEE